VFNRHKVQDIQAKTSNIHVAVQGLTSDAHLAKIRKWLSPPDPSTNSNAAKEKRHQGTGNWFLTSSAFREWKSGSRRHLWLHGLAGCGKTVLTSTILDHLRAARNGPPDSCVCLDFFFDFREKDKQDLNNMLRSFAFQLYSQCADSQKDLFNLFVSCEDGRKQPTTESLAKTLHGMMQRPSKVQIIVDALDECTTRVELLSWMKTLSISDLTRVYLIATSRQEDELESGLSEWIYQENRIPIDKDSVNEDIRSYIKARLQESKEFQKRWASSTSVQEEIESVVGGKADGM